MHIQIVAGNYLRLFFIRILRYEDDLGSWTDYISQMPNLCNAQRGYSLMVFICRVNQRHRVHQRS
jgi:hypothetical protein